MRVCARMMHEQGVFDNYLNSHSILIFLLNCVLPLLLNVIKIADVSASIKYSVRAVPSTTKVDKHETHTSFLQPPRQNPEVMVHLIFFYSVSKNLCLPMCYVHLRLYLLHEFVPNINNRKLGVFTSLERIIGVQYINGFLY